MTTTDPAPGPDTPEAAIASGVPADAAEAVLADAATAVDSAAEVLDMDPLDHPRRLLLVHAHPDDETIATGATMARYAAQGALVTLVTCTRGEEGEIVVDDLGHLAADATDALGPHRVAELATACEALGVTDHRFLGGVGRWRDSGMMGTPDNDDPVSFWQADLDQAVGALVAILREVRPQVVITYDPNGGYGHPDHIQAHRVTMAAVRAAADPAYPGAVGESWQVAKVYWTAIPKSFLQAGIDALRDTPGSMFAGVDSAEDLPFGVPDSEITTEIDGREHFEAKVAALRAHRSQVSTDGPFFALADGVGVRAWGFEHFTLAEGVPGPGTDERGWETDLFSGVA